MTELDDDAIVVWLSTAQVTFFIGRTTRSIVTYSCGTLHNHNTVARPLLMAAPEMYRVLHSNPVPALSRILRPRGDRSQRGEQKQPPADADDWSGLTASIRSEEAERRMRNDRACADVWLLTPGDKTVDLRARVSDVRPSIRHCPVRAQLAF